MAPFFMPVLISAGERGDVFQLSAGGSGGVVSSTASGSRPRPRSGKGHVLADGQQSNSAPLWKTYENCRRMGINSLRQTGDVHALEQDCSRSPAR
jgi:hypothetical protein